MLNRPLVRRLTMMVLRYRWGSKNAIAAAVTRMAAWQTVRLNRTRTWLQWMRKKLRGHRGALLMMMGFRWWGAGGERDSSLLALPCH